MHRWVRIVAGILGLALGSAMANAGSISSDVSRHALAPDQTQLFPLGELNVGEVVFGITTPVSGLPNDFDDPDTQVATFFESDLGPADLSSLILTANDDSDADNNVSSDALGSLYRLEAAFQDRYVVGVTGFDDFFTGSGHGEQGEYLLTMGHIDPTTPGGDFSDSDATNDSRAGADTLGLASNQAKVAVNTLASGAAGDVDFYSIGLFAGDVLTAMTAPLASLSDDFDSPDTMIIVFDAFGNLLFDDDQAGGDLSDFAIDTVGTTAANGSAVHLLAPITGTYPFAVTGFDDPFAVGGHTMVGDYALLVSRVPEPATALMLGLGGALLMPRRARRR